MRHAIIMAAGKGTRMHSSLPKVMHRIVEKPMIGHLIDTLKTLDVDKIVSIVGYGHEIITRAYEGQCEFALQEPQLGTGHAVMQAKCLEGLEGQTLVINGDCPCIKKETFDRMFQELDKGAAMVVLSTRLDDPKAYGRVIFNNEGIIERIVEFKDCNEDQKQVEYINTGIYAFDNKVLFDCLPLLTNDNQQQEYYITDLVEIISKKGLQVRALVTEDTDEVQGINDKVELAYANRYMQKRINEEWMRKGVNIVDPSNTYIGADVTFDEDVVVYPDVYIYGDSHIGKGCVIRPNSYLDNVTLRDGCVVDASRITNLTIDSNSIIGPFEKL